jgi:FkbM family methyltransferase
MNTGFPSDCISSHRCQTMNKTQSQLFLRKVRVALTPRSVLLRTRLENGAIIEAYNRSGYGGRGAYIFGDSLEPELFSLQHFLAAGHVFVDVGANVGLFTVKAAKQVGNDGLVIAIEPFIETALRLTNNVRANGFTNVRVRTFCVGSDTQQTRLHLNQGKPNSFSLVARGNAESISVLSVSLDDLCRWEGLKRLDYLKIDAEGAEAAVLEGAREAISRFRPIVQVEVTICQSTLSLNYRRFTAPASMNNVFIPAENLKAVETAMKLGWVEIGLGQQLRAAGSTE